MPSPWRAFENDLLGRIATTSCLRGAGVGKTFSPYLELQSRLTPPEDVQKTQAITAEQVFDRLVEISGKLEAIAAQEASHVEGDPEAIANDLKQDIETLRQLQAIDPKGNESLRSIFEETIDTGDKLRRGFVAVAYGILKPHEEKYEALNAWIEENYGDKVVLSNAVKSMLKNPKAGKYRDVNLIYAAVELLATHYYQMKVSSGDAVKYHQTMFNTHIEKLHLEDEPSLSSRSRKDKRLQKDYMVRVDNQDHELDRHLKRGGSPTPPKSCALLYMG